jgi:hypothetical protein
LHDRFVTDHCLRSNHRKWSYFDVVSDSRGRIDDCGGVNLRGVHSFGFRYSDFSVLQHACFLETEVAGIPFRWRADDDVIEQLDLQ